MNNIEVYLVIAVMLVALITYTNHEDDDTTGPQTN